MENHHGAGIVSTMISMISASFCLIADIQSIATLIASCIAIVSGIFAIRYYYFATKKINRK